MKKLSARAFDELVAEAVHRIGRRTVFAYLEVAARRYGWPIPPNARAAVVIPLALLVRKRTRLH